MVYTFITHKFYEYYNYYYPPIKSTKIKQKYIKKQIPKAIREQVWIKYIGKVYQHKCLITWCSNTIDVFNFQAGHNIPESKGGDMSLNNLRPICGRCNLSMGNDYTIDEWNKLNSNHNDSFCNLM